MSDQLPLDPALEQHINAAADRLASALEERFFQRINQQLATGFSRQQLALPAQMSLTPYQVDLASLPKLNLANQRLLNHNPSAYFETPVPWPAPANADIPRFLEQIGLARFGPVTRSMRVFCDGTVFVKAASGLWFSVFGVRLNFQSLNNPLRIENQPRFEESPNRNPEMVDFLESLL